MTLKHILKRVETAVKSGFFTLKEIASPQLKGKIDRELWLPSYDPGVPGEIEIPPHSLNQFLKDAFEKDKGNTAFIYFGKKFSYGQLYDLVLRLANGFLQLPVLPGDRVALILPNVPQFLIAYWALLKIGAIVVPINPLLSPKEIEEQISESGARVTIVLDLIYQRVYGLNRQAALPTVIEASIDTYMPSLLGIALRLRRRLQKKKAEKNRDENVLLFEDVLRKPEQIEISVPNTSPAVMLFTGGVTGKPKAAVLTHRNLVANTLQARAWLNDIKDGEERFIAALPFFHSYGMTACHHLAIQSASTLILHPRFNAKSILKSIEKYRATIFPGVPTMFASLVAHKMAAKYDFSSLRACISGGAPLPATVKENFERLTRARLVEGYGLTEASPVTHCNPIHGSNKTGSIGLPWPSTDARIVDLTSGRKLPIGRVGELEVRGPQVMLGYWRKPQETRNVLTDDGWLKTGDIARCDEHGYFYIVDRKKDVIFYGGYNIYPSEVEALLLQHPKISEIAVVGVPDDYYGEIVKAFIVPAPGAKLKKEEILEYCDPLLAHYKTPRQIEFVEQLPKNFLGKVVRRKLRSETGMTK